MIQQIFSGVKKSLFILLMLFALIFIFPTILFGLYPIIVPSLQIFIFLFFPIILISLLAHFINERINLGKLSFKHVLITIAAIAMFNMPAIMLNGKELINNYSFSKLIFFILLISFINIIVFCIFYSIFKKYYIDTNIYKDINIYKLFKIYFLYLSISAISILVFSVLVNLFFPGLFEFKIPSMA